MAYEAFHPELCERRVSKHRKQELVVYRLPDGKPFRYIRVAYTFENVTDSDAVAPYTDINAYQDGIKLDRSYKVQDQRAQKQIEPGGKLKSFTAFAPDSETVPVTVKVMAPGEKEPRSERCYCIVNPGLQ